MTEHGSAVIPTGGTPEAPPEWRNLVSQVDDAYNENMPTSKTYYVYIMANQSRTLCVGFTSDIKKRVWEHKAGLVAGFTYRYNIDTLVLLSLLATRIPRSHGRNN